MSGVEQKEKKITQEALIAAASLDVGMTRVMAVVGTGGILALGSPKLAGPETEETLAKIPDATFNLFKQVVIRHKQKLLQWLAINEILNAQELSNLRKANAPQELALLRHRVLHLCRLVLGITQEINSEGASRISQAIAKAFKKDAEVKLPMRAGQASGIIIPVEQSPVPAATLLPSVVPPALGEREGLKDSEIKPDLSAGSSSSLPKSR